MALKKGAYTGQRSDIFEGELGSDTVQGEDDERRLRY